MSYLELILTIIGIAVGLGVIAFLFGWTMYKGYKR